MLYLRWRLKSKILTCSQAKQNAQSFLAIMNYIFIEKNVSMLHKGDNFHYIISNEGRVSTQLILIIKSLHIVVKHPANTVPDAQ